MSQNKSSAVMAGRVEPPDSLDYFPTPPWATRAFCEWLDHLMNIRAMHAWEPACGAGDMVHPLREYFRTVTASDVRDYGYGFEVGDFLMTDPAKNADWIITNPPFRLAREFVHEASRRSRRGFAMLCRIAFLESENRFREIFVPMAPSYVLVFAERLPMFKGRLDPDGSSATCYAWFVWLKDIDTAAHLVVPKINWIPPGTRALLERAADYPQEDLKSVA